MFPNGTVDKQLSSCLAVFCRLGESSRERVPLIFFSLERKLESRFYVKRKYLPVLTPNKNRPFRAILRNILHHSSRFYVEVMMQYFSEVHFENWLCIHVNDYCEFCQISMNIFSYRAPPVDASWMRILVPFLHFGTTTSLTHFSPVSHFYTSWKPKVFWRFQGV